MTTPRPRTDKIDSTRSQGKGPLIQPAWRSLGSHLRLWPVLAAVLWADLESKRAVFDWLGEPPGAAVLPGEPAPRVWTALPGVLEFRTQYNMGAALGVMQGYTVVFVAAGVAAIVLFLLLFAHTDRRQWFLHVGIGLILGGALGNIYDRLALGMVRDFIHVTARFGGHWIGRWPGEGVYPWIFNIADMALVVGAAAVILSWLAHSRRLAAAEPTEPAQGRPPGRPRR